MEDTVFVTLADEKYYNKAKKTTVDLRTRGGWNGDIVIIVIGFKLNVNFRDFYNVTEKSFPLIDKSNLLRQIGKKFPDGDGREFDKINQWEKLHVFDEFFSKWKRVIFLDAGLRVVDSVKYLLELDYKGAFLAPNDAGYYNRSDKIFKFQLSFYNPSLIEKVKLDFGEHVFESQYFLNCIWVYDTDILKICNKDMLIKAMNDYPLCRTNEMALMNLLLHFKYKLWKPFPNLAPNNKYFFEWNEKTHSHATTWRNYCYIKYSSTIKLDDT